MKRLFIYITFNIFPGIVSGIYAQEDNLVFKRMDIEDGMSSRFITCINQDKLGFMWFGTENGLNRFDGYSFKVYNFNRDDSTTIGANSVWSLFRDTKGILWVGTDGGGMSKYNAEKDAFIRYSPDNKNPQAISNGAVRCIYEDKSGRLWAGTWGGGLNRMNEDGKTFYHYRNDPNNPRSLSSDIVVSIEEDSEGRLWIATWGGGLNRYNPKTDDFTQVSS